MTISQRTREVCQQLRDDGEISASDDGYLRLWTKRGYLSSHNLREIADLLDEWNKPWDDRIGAVFGDSGGEVV